MKAYVGYGSLRFSGSMGLLSPASVILVARSVMVQKYHGGGGNRYSLCTATAAETRKDSEDLVPAGLGLLGGLLLAFSLPPWPVSTGAWPLALVGAACLFAAGDGRRFAGRLGVAVAAGLAFYLPALWWIRDFSVPGLIATVTLEALILALALTLVPASGLVRIVAFPSALVVAEAVRGAFPFGGLPLAGIDLGQAGGPLAPVARLGGRLLIVGVVGLAGAGLATLVVTASGRPGGHGWRRWWGAWRGSAWQRCWPRPGGWRPPGRSRDGCRRRRCRAAGPGGCGPSTAIPGGCSTPSCGRPPC